jgi:hypothetical protein
MLVILLAAQLTGCKGSARDQAFTGQFHIISLAEAPAALQAHFEGARLLPGLAVLQQEGRTYLLLTAGRSEQPGLTVDVVDVQKPAKEGKREVQIIARLMPGRQPNDLYPATILVFDGTPDFAFKARLATRSESVLELSGLTLQ